MEAYVYWISGRVQGVGFRWFTEREATRLRVHGYVRNLEDGRVEVLAQGEVKTLKALESRLKLGPSAAVVAAVERREVPVDTSLSSFQVRY